MTDERALQVLSDLSRSLISTPPDAFIQQVAVKAADLLSAPVCIVWKLDEQHGRLRVVATTDNVDDKFRNLELNLDDPGILRHLESKMAGYVQDVTKAHPNLAPVPEDLSKRGWKSLLSAPMWANDKLIGMLDIYTTSVRSFTSVEKNIFSAFAYHAAAAIQKADLFREALAAREILQQLNYRIAVASDSRELLSLVLDGALELVKSRRGWISLLDPITGQLEIITYRGEKPRAQALKVGHGITGLSLQREQPLLVGDVTAEEWRAVNVEYLPDARSALAVPILITNSKVRIGSNTESSTKPIGVLNIESPELNAFTVVDRESLWSWACLAAIKIEHLELDRKLRDLRSVETEIVGERSFDKTIKIVMKAITQTLGYDYVNISLVVPETNSIKTEYITGIDSDQVESFKALSNHSLDSSDIQAWVVSNREIVVPGRDDVRYDKRIFAQFRHKDLIRVFIPMIVPSDGRVIGTVEAGYQRPGYRRYIYEQDIQILQSFLNYAVQALEQRKKGLLETIAHEFRAPIVGIRSTASFLQRRGHELSDEHAFRKLGDILTDSEILLLQVEELEYVLGRARPSSKLTDTLVFRDVIIKCIKQLERLVEEHGFHTKDIEYRPEDIGKIRLYVDKLRLTQVFYNLLINSIKYSEDDQRLFKIRISVDQTSDNYIIKLKDWGLGVRKGLEEKVFETGFRTPEALNKNVTGSGLGLSIARTIMREMGGDLRLVNNHKPTEFHVILPKKPKGMPK